MRQHPVLDDGPEDEASPPPILVISSAPRAHPSAAEAKQPRPEPWTPREPHEFDIPRQPEPEQPAPTPPARPDRSRRWAPLALLAIALGILAGALTWYPRADSDREAAPIEGTPPGPTDERVRAGAPSPDSAADAPADGLGPVTAEVRVLQPNYTVAPGDTLAIIARRHGTSIEAIASLNKLENRNALRVGQRLIIP